MFLSVKNITSREFFLRAKLRNTSMGVYNKFVHQDSIFHLSVIVFSGPTEIQHLGYNKRLKIAARVRLR